MKIAHLNTHTYGGAAIVARRLHQALLNNSIESKLITKYGINKEIRSHIYFKNGKLRDFIRKGPLSPLLFPVAKSIRDKWPYSKLYGRPEGFEIFSLLNGSAPNDFFDILQEQDIINLHWVSNFIDYKYFFQRFKNKKFVWTLHDMNPFTGGCHHSDGCMKFESDCLKCPQLINTKDENFSSIIQETKQNALSSLREDQLIIVTPSKWLSDLSQKSRINGKFKHVIIPNPSFKIAAIPETRDQLRKQLGLPLQKKIILFVSDNLNNKRKGIDLLIEAIRSMDNVNNLFLLGIGMKPKEQEFLNISYTGIISNAEHMSRYFYCADIFVTPSLAENSPLVVIESLCCGTPVAASRVGGIPDLIDQENGILFEAGNIKELSNAIIKILFQKTYHHDNIQNKARAIHEPSIVANKYLEIYNSLLN